MTTKHSENCGTAYRGCAPDCPKDRQEKIVASLRALADACEAATAIDGSSIEDWIAIDFAEPDRVYNHDADQWETHPIDLARVRLKIVIKDGDTARRVAEALR